MTFRPTDTFESFDQTARDNATTMRCFARAGRPDLAEALSQCSDDHPCEIEACQRCGRDYRLQLMNSAYDLGLHEGFWTTATIFTTGLLVTQGRLHTIDLTAEVKRMRRLISRSELAGNIVIGSLDVCFAYLDDDPLGWQLFPQLLINAPRTNKLEHQVEDAFPPEPAAIQPYFLQGSEPSSFFERFSRGLKRKFWVRRTYSDPVNARLARNQQLSKSPTGDQLSELMVWLAEHPLGVRTIRCNIRIRRSADGTREFRLKAPLVRP